ncbi:hypothetical protein Q9L58_006869 [Maublancomyces gigas]|uniref:Uncharacterized protein n=1 Tax=Discina gigas TaxID=1032678 RepID=A0ABR3GEG9_9PEZI
MSRRFSRIIVPTEMVATWVVSSSIEELIERLGTHSEHVTQTLTIIEDIAIDQNEQVRLVGNSLADNVKGLTGTLETLSNELVGAIGNLDLSSDIAELTARFNEHVTRALAGAIENSATQARSIEHNLTSAITDSADVIEKSIIKELMGTIKNLKSDHINQAHNTEQVITNSADAISDPLVTDSGLVTQALEGMQRPSQNSQINRSGINGLCNKPSQNSQVTRSGINRFALCDLDTPLTLSCTGLNKHYL